ncbi:MAG: phosphoribosylanthranilate isomerase [halophilic archaeon J07HX5]|jgi:Phosphoribosylanthranilate isomerase|nr:MAG: phosphoribosylanthranilate isomerase [halophilic archaeon J07HX5]
MLVQLYSLTHPDDIQALVELGVDRFGFAVGDQGLPAEVPLERAHELFALVPDDRTTTVLSVHTAPAEAAAFARRVRPDLLHRCPPPGTDDPTDLRALASALPADVALMTAVAVGTDTAAIDRAAAVATHSDALVVDSAAPDIPGVGATGESHDWSVSRRIVDRVDVPVVLAGGLGPDNVAAAIRAVRPAGVDSYTRTSRTDRRKHIDRTRAFVQAARAAQ